MSLPGARGERAELVIGLRPGTLGRARLRYLTNLMLCDTDGGALNTSKLAQPPLRALQLVTLRSSSPLAAAIRAGGP
jgi:hypothetical protein